MKLLPVAALVAAAALFLAPAAAQQTPAPAHDHSTPAPQAGAAMDHDKMMAGMKAADARLEELVQKMKSSQGADKTAVMQELLTQLVQNQVDMHGHMSMMHAHMMSQPAHK